MDHYKIYAQLEPIRKERSRGVVEFLANIVPVRTIKALNKEQAFRIAKTIIPHPLVERALTQKEIEQHQRAEEERFHQHQENLRAC